MPSRGLPPAGANLPRYDPKGVAAPTRRGSAPGRSVLAWCWRRSQLRPGPPLDRDRVRQQHHGPDIDLEWFTGWFDAQWADRTPSMWNVSNLATNCCRALWSSLDPEGNLVRPPRRNARVRRRRSGLGCLVSPGAATPVVHRRFWLAPSGGRCVRTSGRADVPTADCRPAR